PGPQLDRTRRPSRAEAAVPGDWAPLTRRRRDMSHLTHQRLRPCSPRRLGAILFSALMVAALGVAALPAAQAAPTGQTGTIQTVAGNMVNYAQFGYSGDGGAATSAQLYNPRAIAFGQNGTVFIADALNERI